MRKRHSEGLWGASMGLCRPGTHVEMHRWHTATSPSDEETPERKLAEYTERERARVTRLSPLGVQLGNEMNVGGDVRPSPPTTLTIPRRLSDLTRT